MSTAAQRDPPGRFPWSMCVARVRNGLVPVSLRQVFEKIRRLVSPTMPFVNLPGTHKSRWGDELTTEKMKECVWLRPAVVAQSARPCDSFLHSSPDVSLRCTTQNAKRRTGLSYGDSTPRNFTKTFAKGHVWSDFGCSERGHGGCFRSWIPWRRPGNVAQFSRANLLAPPSKACGLVSMRCFLLFVP